MAAKPSDAPPHFSVPTLALLRTSVGLMSLALPTNTAALFGIEAHDGSRIVTRLFGAREVVLGALLWDAQRRARKDLPQKALPGGSEAWRLLRWLLWINVAVDSIDVVSSAVCVVEGSMGGRAIWLVGAGAAAFAGLGGMGLSALV